MSTEIIPTKEEETHASDAHDVRTFSRSARSGRNRGQGPTLYNCIVDDATLIQGAKSSTRDGLRKWVAEERMRVFVPLYALDRISQFKDKSSGRLATDIAESLEWLDEATSSRPDLVTLQGGYDKFERWTEVEAFQVPRPLFSEQDAATAGGNIGQPTIDANSHDFGDDIDEALTSRASRASRTSPAYKSPADSKQVSTSVDQSMVGRKREHRRAQSHEIDSNQGTSNFSGEKDVPQSVQPLLNYILWRIHQESDPSSALKGFIFLTDNKALREQAQRFGIRCKSLSEIRQIIVKNSRGANSRHPNRALTSNIAPTSGSSRSPTATADGKHTPESEEDEILIGRISDVELLDPDQFTRLSTKSTNAPEHIGITQRNAPQSTRRGRYRSASRGRGKPHSPQPSVVIDPESFDRPPSSKGRSGRGSRGLWTPR